MIGVPAIDLREGACVQLVGGSFAAERVRIADPLAQAAAFRADGFRHLHVVDLDAATGRGDNAGVIDQLLARSEMSVSVGGGVRTARRALELAERGAGSVIVGTRAIEDAAFLRDLTMALPRRIVVALDVREREVLVRGWSAGSGRRIDALLGELDAMELAGVLVTAVHVEGTLAGVDADLYREVVAATKHPIIASGGIGKLDDLRALAALGVKSAVIGMALYTGAIDGASVAREFSE